MRHSLILHPDCRSGAVERIDVEISRAAASLRLDFAVLGDMAALELPPVAACERADGLWRHTCFEAFVRPVPGAAYREFNFAPSTQWAAYDFDAYRDGMRDADAAPKIAIVRDDRQFRLSAAFAVAGSPLRLGLSAVIAGKGGGKSYWALAHPAGKPDFHHPDCFALELPAA